MSRALIATDLVAAVDDPAGRGASEGAGDAPVTSADNWYLPSKPRGGCKYYAGALPAPHVAGGWIAAHLLPAVGSPMKGAPRSPHLRSVE